MASTMENDEKKRKERCEQALKKMEERATAFATGSIMTDPLMADQIWSKPKAEILKDIYIQGYSQGRSDEFDENERLKAEKLEKMFQEWSEATGANANPPNPSMLEALTSKPACSKLTESDLSAEAWREYFMLHNNSVYRIENPVKLYMRPGGTTHRVLDSKGIVHCVIAPGPECVLRWQNREGFPPCQF